VGLIYRSDKVKSISSDFIRIHFPGNENKKTRDILYFKALINNDTLHIFVNHWPSRRGGKKKSDPARMQVASILKEKTDSLFRINPDAHIIITGDFNDEPQDKSLNTGLGAVSISNQSPSSKLNNLSWDLKTTCKCGTYRLDNSWEMLDQFIISGTLFKNSAVTPTLNIGKFDFLLKDDTKFGGYKPFRTYQGPAYKGGFSDHLPVYLDIYYLKKKQ
jgi:predicted extracellular nuclease